MTFVTYCNLSISEGLFQLKVSKFQKQILVSLHNNEIFHIFFALAPKIGQIKRTFEVESYVK